MTDSTREDIAYLGCRINHSVEVAQIVAERTAALEAEVERLKADVVMATSAFSRSDRGFQEAMEFIRQWVPCVGDCGKAGYFCGPCAFRNSLDVTKPLHLSTSSEPSPCPDCNDEGVYPAGMDGSPTPWTGQICQTCAEEGP